MLESFAYLLVLLISLIGLGILDFRFKLALFYDRKATIQTVALGVLFFIIWDVLGIGLGIFFIGESRYVSGLNVLPELPVEELFFLTLLCYNALLLWRAGEKLCSRT